MKERPILFKGELVRAIQADRKTQTRRLMKPQPVGRAGSVWPAEDRWGWSCAAGRTMLDEREAPCCCPHGYKRDRLWVRESFRYEGHGAGPGVIYPADLDDYDRAEKGPWKPSIHMPRSASRILLEITEVRVQPLQDITEDDIIAEGCTVDAVAKMTGVPWSSMPTLHIAWRQAWEHVNGDRAPWASNPWVWAISFRKVES